MPDEYREKTNDEIAEGQIISEMWKGGREAKINRIGTTIIAFCPICLKKKEV